MHIFITTKNHAKHALTYETLLICIHLLILNYRYQPKYLNYLRIVKKYTSFFSSPPMLHPPNGRNNSRRKSRRKKSRTTTMPTNWLMARNATSCMRRSASTLRRLKHSAKKWRDGWQKVIYFYFLYNTSLFSFICK